MAVRPVLVLTLAALVGVSAADREVLSFDPGWRFHLGDIPFPEVKGHGATYGYAKAGNAVGAAATVFDDTAWRVLDLPHDWAVEGPFDKEANLSQGYRPRGFGWYRKRFTLPESDKGKHIELQFEGIATHATVWVNGTVMHRNFSGYTGFTIDLTQMAKYGGEQNVIAVKVDAVEQEGWWYEGAGIYRQTALVKRHALHVVTDGVFAQPVLGTDGTWTIPVEARLGNATGQPADVTVTSVLLDPEGREVARASGPGRIAALGEGTATFNVTVPGTPRRWSLEEPTLYRVRTTITANGEQADAVETTCGFRTIRFDAKEGFFLNDKPVKLKGTCNHQDHAGVGTVIQPSLWAWRVKRLKDLGSNAYRASHNAPARELLAECDRQGMLVMDENRNFNISPEYQGQLEWLVRRDRNHPSVIMWSVFNEESMQGTETGYEMVRKMSAVVKRLDTTRPVTAAMSGGHQTPLNVSHAVDVVGFNYNQNVYDGFHTRYPEKPVLSSEDTSGYMTRGEWFTDKPRNIIGSQDDQRAPWGNTHRAAWKLIAERTFVGGGFVWTGFDYRGEPTPHSWPSVGSYFGIYDQCGFPKTAAYIHQAAWIDDRPILKVQPHWNWAGKEGQEIPVMVLSNADTVRLSLDGKDLGSQPVDRLMGNTWKVAYAPGRLEAVATKGGQEVARDVVETTGAPAALRLVPERSTAAGDGRDTLPVTVEVVDAQGRVVPTAGPKATFTVAGPARIAGIGNGDPTCHEPEQDAEHSLFNGLAQVILTTAPGSGTVRLTATAPGLAPASTEIAVAAAPVPPSVAGLEAVLTLGRWKMSAVAPGPLDPNLVVADNDQNTWTNVEAKTPQVFKGGTQALYRISVTPYAAQAKDGGVLLFTGILGQAEVWIDGARVATKTDPAAGPLEVPLAPGAKARAITVLVTVAEEGAKGGFTGPVKIGGR